MFQSGEHLRGVSILPLGLPRLVEKEVKAPGGRRTGHTGNQPLKQSSRTARCENGTQGVDEAEIEGPFGDACTLIDLKNEA